MIDRVQVQIRRRKIRDRSIALVIVGTALLLPPVANLSLVGGWIAGLPPTLVYLFSVWIALVAGAMALARPLEAGDETGHSGEKES